MGILKQCAFSALFFIFLAVVIEYGLRKEFKVHSSGAVVISGTSSGIGRDAVFALAKHGFVVFCGVRSVQDIKSLEEEAVTFNLEEKVRPILMDVVNSTQIDAAVVEVSSFLKETGLPMVGVVNNAGISNRYPIETVILDKARQLFEVNYFGGLVLTQKFLPLIRQHQGRILFISSISGIAPLPGSGIYSSTKRALEALVDSLRMEMLPFGVSVTSILPGYIKTPISGKGFSNYNETVSEELYKIYKLFFETVGPKRASVFKDAPGPQVTSEAILQAMVEQYPRTRYFIGSAGDFPIKIIPILLGIIPDRLADFIKMERH